MDVTIPDIPMDERTPAVLQLLEVVQLLLEKIELLDEEIKRLKGLKPKLKVPKSNLEGPGAQTQPPSTGLTKNPPKRPGSAKRAKTAELKIHDTKVIAPPHVPEGSTRKGFQDYTVQDLQILSFNTRYRLECWQTPTGEFIHGELPADVRERGHFGPTLIAYILKQHYQLQVPQPRLLDDLRGMGVDISAGHLNNILTQKQDPFHEEKDTLLPAGLAVSGHVGVDDTGARHQGHAGFCTVINNDFFAVFHSSDTKSRLNFLEILRGQHSDYVLNPTAFAYFDKQGLAGYVSNLFREDGTCTFASQEAWKQHLAALGIETERQVRIATEGAVLGSAVEHGLPLDLVILSDDAGQFNLLVLAHALCWIHAERNINKLTPFSDQQRADWDKVRADIWELYAGLKAYKLAPTADQKAVLEARFDELCARSTCFAGLNQALKTMKANKAELLLVLDRPDIPLHTNATEQALRDAATKRKISGGTRSDLGRKCRDTFLSLRKTCKKLGISFWSYLQDRIFKKGAIPPLSEVIRERARASACPVR